MTVTSAKSPDVEKFWLGIKMYYLSLKAIEYNALHRLQKQKIALEYKRNTSSIC